MKISMLYSNISGNSKISTFLLIIPKCRDNGFFFQIPINYVKVPKVRKKNIGKNQRTSKIVKLRIILQNLRKSLNPITRMICLQTNIWRKKTELPKSLWIIYKFKDISKFRNPYKLFQNSRTFRNYEIPEKEYDYGTFQNSKQPKIPEIPRCR